MIFIKLLFAYSIPVTAGYLLVTFFSRHEKRYGTFEKIFLGYGLGSGLLALWIFLVGTFKIRYSILSLSSMPVLTIILLWIKLSRSKPAFSLKLPLSNGLPLSRPRSLLHTCLTGILLIWILFKLFFVFYHGLNFPIFSWDTWGNWSAGAKFFYYRQGLALDPSDPHFFGRGYRPLMGHPLLSPLLQVWTAEWLGEFHEAFVKTWSPLYFSGLLGLFFCAIRRETSYNTALISTFMLASAPILTYHATDAYSDLPLGYYSFAACYCFWRFLKTEDKNSLMLSGIFSGICVFTKNEGIFFACAICFSLLLYFFINNKKPKSDFIRYLFPFFLAAGPLIVFKKVYGLGYSHEMKQQFIGLELTLKALLIMGKVFFAEANFNLVFPFLIFMVLLDRKPLFREDTRYIFLILLLVISGFFLVYIMSDFEFREALVYRMSVNRNIITYIAIAYFLAAITGHARWNDTFSQKKKGDIS